jgi:hypothetical protein
MTTGTAQKRTHRVISGIADIVRSLASRMIAEQNKAKLPVPLARLPSLIGISFFDFQYILIEVLLSYLKCIPNAFFFVCHF